MLYCPPKYAFQSLDRNKEFLKLQGELDERKAKITLAEFLRVNLGFTVELISGIKLAEYQEIILKALFVRNFSMCVIGRGGSKSFIAAVFCFLYSIFEPNTKILIAGPTFRTTKNIFAELEKIVKSPSAQLLADCFSAKPSKRNDLFEWEINGGSIKSIPLNGQKIRGIRANVLLVDEFLLMSETIVEQVLMPFLMTSQGVADRIATREREDDLIKRRLMKEEEREKFISMSKMVCLSSASFSFEFLFKKYQDWVNKIYSDQIHEAKYFVCQLSYLATPEYMWDKNLIEEAKSTNSHSNFMREYCAQFVDDSDSYYSARKMELCTIPDGQSPHLELVGNKESEYVLAVDPSFSSSATSDNFAMTVLKINEQKHGIVVHQYAVAGGNLQDHILYLTYLLTHFNIVLMILDRAGGRQFIEAANLSEHFISRNLNYKFFEFDSDKEGTQDYPEILRKARNEYNLQDKRVVIEQHFSSAFIRKANEQLQANIDHKRIFFASKITPNGNLFETCVDLKLPMELIRHYCEDVGELISEQDILIGSVKKECALIEVKTTGQGTQSFDLPLNLVKTKSANKARKDSFTALFLGNWAVKIYQDMMNYKQEAVQTGFIPFFAA